MFQPGQSKKVPGTFWHLLVFILFLAQSLCYFWARSLFNQQELAKANLAAELLVAQNAPFLQNGLEPLLSTQKILQYPGVRDAWFQLDDSPPLERVTLQQSPSRRGWIRIEKSLEKGKAVLLYQPQAFPSIRFWLVGLFPLAAELIFFWVRRKPKSEPLPIPPSYPWLAPLEKLLAKKLHIFDPAGNILAAAPQTQAKHILDLFSQPEQSQQILKKIDDWVLHPEAHATDAEQSLSFWREEDGAIRFLLLDD